MAPQNDPPIEPFSPPAGSTPVILRRSELLNLTVMDRSEMEMVGRIERLWMYPQAHRVLGIVCKPGGLFSKQRQVYKLPQLDSFGQGNLWVNGPAQVTTAEQLQQLQSLMDHEVWVDGGDRLGRIIDCLFNRKTGEITQYLFADNRWRRLLDNPLNLPPGEMLSFGNGRVLVAPQTLARLGQERPNLKQTWAQMREQARAEYDQVTQQTSEQVRHWSHGAKSLKQRLADQAESLSQQAAERAKRLREQAQELTQELGQELGQDLTPERGQRGQTPGDPRQGLGSRVGEQYHQLQRRAREFVEELPPLELGGLAQPAQRGRDDGAERDWAGSEHYSPERSPSDYSSYGHDPAESDEVTWIDEAGELPPGRSAPRSWRDRRDRLPDPPGSASPPPNEPLPSMPTRDNPWGYDDQATESDWEAFDLAFGPGSQTRTPGDAPPLRDTPEGSIELGETPTSDFAPYDAGLIAPEDLDSDDPWI